MLTLLVLFGLSFYTNSQECLSPADQVLLEENTDIFNEMFANTIDMIQAAEMYDLAWSFGEQSISFANGMATLLEPACVICVDVESFIDETINLLVYKLSYAEPDWERHIENGDPVFVKIGDLLAFLKNMKPECRYTNEPIQSFERFEGYSEDEEDDFFYWTGPDSKPEHNNKIINGTRVTRISDWPFIVSIGGCTGSLISARCVLSAQHCGTSARTARIQGFTRTSGGTVFNVAGYAAEPGGLDIHIAVLTSAPSNAFPRVRVAGYTVANGRFNNTNGWTAGYGATRLDRTGGGTLRQVSVRMFRTSASRIDVCPVGNTNCRTGGATGGPLWGDSGGPLMSGNWHQLGTVRGGRGNGIHADYINTDRLGSWMRSVCG